MSVSTPSSTPSPETAATAAPSAESAPRALLAVGAIVGVEGLIGVGYGVYLLAAAIFGSPREFGQAIAVGVTITLIAAPLVLVARGLARARMWARTPSVMAQLLALWMSYYMVKANAYVAAVPTIAVAIAGLVGIFLPASTSALTKHWRED
jgi:hypothetical protein